MSKSIDQRLSNIEGGIKELAEGVNILLTRSHLESRLNHLYQLTSQLDNRTNFNWALTFGAIGIFALGLSSFSFGYVIQAITIKIVGAILMVLALATIVFTIRQVHDTRKQLSATTTQAQTTQDELQRIIETLDDVES